VVAADDVAVLHEALRELRGAVAAAVGDRGGRAVGLLPQHDVLAHQREGLGAVVQADIGISAYQKRRSTFCLVVSTGHLLHGWMRVQPDFASRRVPSAGQQALAHQHAGAVAGHALLVAAATSTGASASTDSRMTLSSSTTCVSQSLSSAAGQSSSVSLRYSHWINWMRSVVDRRGAGEDGVLDAAGIDQAQLAQEGQVPLVGELRVVTGRSCR
jgi:hypothetical protein